MRMVVGSLLVMVTILAAAPLAAQRRSDVITEEEIERVTGKGGTALDAVQTLRPRWLKARELLLTASPEGPFLEEGPHVYLNDIDQGSAEYLRTIPAERVAHMRWLSATQAASRFGPTSNPAIVVTLKRWEP